MDGVVLDDAFYYYVHEIRNDPKYNPQKDDHIPTTYVATRDDMEFLV